MSKRVLVVDDHAVVRAGVRTILAGNPEWEICGEAEDGEEGIEKVQQLTPDVVLLDLSMPGMNDFEAAALILQTAPATKIVFFSMHQIPTSSRLVGAHGFVSKNSAGQDLLAMLEYVYRLEKGASAASGAL